MPGHRTIGLTRYITWLSPLPYSLFITRLLLIPIIHKIHFLGFSFLPDALYTYALSFAFLVIAAISPLLSGIADYSGNKKIFMKFFCYMGALACSLLYFFTASTFGLA